MRSRTARIRGDRRAAAFGVPLRPIIQIQAAYSRQKRYVATTHAQSRQTQRLRQRRARICIRGTQQRIHYCKTPRNWQYGALRSPVRIEKAKLNKSVIDGFQGGERGRRVGRAGSKRRRHWGGKRRGCREEGRGVKRRLGGAGGSIGGGSEEEGAEGWEKGPGRERGRGECQGIGGREGGGGGY